MTIRTAEDFYRAVKIMRETQQEYVRGRSPMVMRLAQRQAAEIDKFIADRERRLADAKQGALIGGGAGGGE
ncbi:MAG: hypothetical protein LBO80_07165 [Treponema sp.]|jgi:hypothetical protein|nr:hypothetical protein [Treponema sp.]